MAELQFRLFCDNTEGKWCPHLICSVASLLHVIQKHFSHDCNRFGRIVFLLFGSCYHREWILTVWTTWGHVIGWKPCAIIFSPRVLYEYYIAFDVTLTVFEFTCGNTNGEEILKVSGAHEPSDRVFSLALRPLKGTSLYTGYNYSFTKNRNIMINRRWSRSTYVQYYHSKGKTRLTEYRIYSIEKNHVCQRQDRG